MLEAETWDTNTTWWFSVLIKDYVSLQTHVVYFSTVTIELWCLLFPKVGQAQLCLESILIFLAFVNTLSDPIKYQGCDSKVQ